MLWFKIISEHELDAAQKDAFIQQAAPQVRQILQDSIYRDGGMIAYNPFFLTTQYLCEMFKRRLEPWHYIALCMIFSIIAMLPLNWLFGVSTFLALPVVFLAGCTFPKQAERVAVGIMLFVIMLCKPKQQISIALDCCSFDLYVHHAYLILTNHLLELGAQQGIFLFLPYPVLRDEMQRLILNGQQQCSVRNKAQIAFSRAHRLPHPLTVSRHEIKMEF